MRHPECDQPVMFVVPQVKVVPGPQRVRDKLQVNRASFVALHSTMQELASRFARHAALLEKVARTLHIEVTFRGTSSAATAVSSPGSKGGAMRNGAIELFFMLLPVALGYALPPSVDGLCDSMVVLLTSLGENFLRGDGAPSPCNLYERPDLGTERVVGLPAKFTLPAHAQLRDLLVARCVILPAARIP